MVSQWRSLKQALNCPEFDPRWIHEYVHLAANLGIVWHAKDFAKTPEADADAGETQPGSYDGLGCPHEWSDVFTISSELQDSVRPAL